MAGFMVVYCENCNTELRRRKTSANKKRNRFFCNQSCYFAWLRENRPAEQIRPQSKAGEYLAELQRVSNQLQHLPTMQEFEEISNIKPKLIAKYFGTWYFALSNITDPSTEAKWNIDNVLPEDGGWLSGLADGESTFRLGKQKYSFTCIWGFQLRADDIFAAEEAKKILGLDSRPLRYWIRSTDRAKGVNAGDAVRFYIRDIPTLYAHVLPFFRRFPLRSKKRFEFTHFAKAVELLFDHQSKGLHKKYPDKLVNELTEIKSTLEILKKYTEPSELEEFINSQPTKDVRKHYRRRVL